MTSPCQQQVEICGVLAELYRPAQKKMNHIIVKCDVLRHFSVEGGGAIFSFMTIHGGPKNSGHRGLFNSLYYALNEVFFMALKFASDLNS